MQERIKTDASFLGIPVPIRRLIMNLLSGVDYLMLRLVNKQLKIEAEGDPNEIDQAKNTFAVQEVLSPLNGLGSSYSLVREQISKTDFKQKNTKEEVLKKLAQLRLERQAHKKEVLAITKSQTKTLQRMTLANKRSYSFELDKKAQELEKRYQEKTKEKESHTPIRATKTL